jgi:hypothetical protein
LIDFRYHIVSLIAVFLALALGLFLGSTTLQSTVTNNLQKQAHRVTSENGSLEAKNSQLAKQVKAETSFVAALEPYVVGNRLSGDSVAVVSAPGVDSGQRKAIENTLALAGATVTADVQLQSSYLDPSQDAELGQLASQLVLPGHRLPAGSGSAQASSELAAVLLARPTRHAVARAKVDQVLSALSDGKFISVSGAPPSHPATLAVLLTATPASGTTAAALQTQDSTLVELARAMRASSTAEVVAGPPASGSSAGALTAVRSDSSLSRSVSTVDLSTADQASGRVSIVLALAGRPNAAAAFGLGQTPPVPATSAGP